MANTVRVKYSNTAGNVPSSLVDGQIAVQQADGRLFYRASDGTVTQFSGIASYATTASFPATGSAKTLYLSQDTSRLHQWNGTVYIEVGVSGGGGSGGGGSTSASDLTSGTLSQARLDFVPIHPFLLMGG
jgi:hypothetical protein